MATCRQLPYLYKPAIAIVMSFSLWCLSRLRCSQPPLSLWLHSYCDVIHYWAGHNHYYGRTATLPCLIHKDMPPLTNLQWETWRYEN